MTLIRKTRTKKESRPSADRESLEIHLRDSLSKLEHRVKVLAAISDHQQAAGRPELAQAYKKQAGEMKVRARSIRRILTSLT